jgi:uncharacterized protein YcfL
VNNNNTNLIASYINNKKKQIVVVNRTFYKFLALGLNVCFVTNKEKDWSFLTLQVQAGSIMQFSTWTKNQENLFLFLSPMPLSHKTTETLTGSTASKTFHK